MSATVGKRLINDVVVLDIAGRMRIEHGGDAVIRQVRQSLEAGRRAYILNLHDLVAIDSSGMAELVRSLQLVDTQDGALCLVGLQPHVERLLEIGRLLTVFPTFTDEGSALAEWRQRQSFSVHEP